MADNRPIISLVNNPYKYMIYNDLISCYGLYFLVPDQMSTAASLAYGSISWLISELAPGALLVARNKNYKKGFVMNGLTRARADLGPVRLISVCTCVVLSFMTLSGRGEQP